MNLSATLNCTAEEKAAYILGYEMGLSLITARAATAFNSRLEWSYYCAGYDHGSYDRKHDPHLN